ncbi:3'-5' exonuclease [Halodesulfovibrio marinisediminis]|uniref:DNA 3'-5' helicase n=1 Tax=Halodesulfovibrio marinisediminis DSM 17456 TaxID=1121457 RepID=A0A1N6FD61_9BACT|nr:3'-5' exonuclease [Halodesulfovibrio marinisediminis]SIN93164.1 UvrD-like helicase C-terminal domain-containing protein [Halodesulfovibrio marinisediminis DSM 17456]
MNSIIYMHTVELYPQLQRLMKRGGFASKSAAKVNEIMGRIYLENPFHGVNTTNHGESRIDHCIKYQLFDGYRLITIKNKKVCLFAFAGSHDECDRWIKKKSGLSLIKNKDNEYDLILRSKDATIKTKRIQTKTDFSNSNLIDRLDKPYRNKFLKLLSGPEAMEFSRLTTQAQDKDILEIASTLADPQDAALLFDVAAMLREGNIEGTLNRLDLHFGDAKCLDSLSDEEVLEIQDGRTVKRLEIGSPEYFAWLEHYIKSSNYQDWMLFMHPTQEKVAHAEYEGPAKLSGVSGSGKTCVVVMRAIYLAKKNPSLPILIATLNKSLAQLINNLLNYACPDTEIRAKIHCSSFFSLCQKQLRKYDPKNEKLFDEVTWKTHEHVDEVWREFYRCELNNNSADVLLPLHKTLNKQGINAEEYLRQEFDWVRSAVADRNDYYKIKRKGRAIPFVETQRAMILDGLAAWEEKMSEIGVIDPVGLAAELSKYASRIQPLFSSILVDEVQDFGTLELSLLNRLVAPGKNDFFVAGDMAQHILPKHQSFKEAGINIPGGRSITFTKNYRNSREILKAAYEVFIHNLDSEIITDGDIELLDPKYANFSTPLPSVLQAESLEEEIAFSLSVAKQHLIENSTQKACIAIVGYSQYEISKLANQAGIQTLDGSAGLLDDNIFFSDLDQTKGYEFDFMCILNCSQEVLPNPTAPHDEYFRDACRFYVAMTRAKSELYLSYTGHPSSWLTNDSCKTFFDFLRWDDLFDFSLEHLIGAPRKLPRNINNPNKNILSYTGPQFIRTSLARGMSLELQNKIEELVDGAGLSRGWERIRWKTVKDAYDDVKAHPHAKTLFGPKTWVEFVDCIEQKVIGLQSRNEDRYEDAI